MTTITVFDINNAAVRLREGRDWLALLQSEFELHPAVITAMQLVGEIKDSVLLQWPHRSTTEAGQIAYTRSEEHGVADRQTRTTQGKYLRAAFPTLKDNVIRDLVYAEDAKVASGFRFITESKEIVHAVQKGPYSCMQWDSVAPEDWQRHPYAVYDPALGWSMAIKEDSGEITARALVYEREHDEQRCWVRAYGANGADYELSAWLGQQGVESYSSWPSGAKLRRISHHGDIMFPYIDGNRDRVDVHGDTLVLKDNGEHLCNSSDGTAEYEEPGEPCDHCEDDTPEEDQNEAGSRGQMMICDHCRDNYFTFVTGARGHEYYVHEDDAVSIDGEQYDVNNLPKEVVETRDGSTQFEEDCCEIDGNWWRTDDPRVCWSEPEQQHLLCANAWQCAATNYWYSEDTEHVEIDGDMYHPDDAPADYDKPDGDISNENQEEINLEA
jgi:hypothetical protein